MLRSINPYTQKEIYHTEEFTSAQVEEAINKADHTFGSWKTLSFSERSKLMLAAARELKKNKKEYAETITAEMGKPIRQSVAEVEKCAWVCEYYAEKAEKHLADKIIHTEAEESYVSYEPIGVVLAVMPWNYPFWQVFRFAAPALMAGNVGVLKHASNVMKSAANIEKVFIRAGFPEGCFTNLPIGSDKVENIIKNRKVKAVTLTGSKPAGGAVASAAGREIKKSVLELGGSNALVVFDDCDIDKTVKTCIQARYQNTGQSCIAGKRLLLHRPIADAFTEKFLHAVRELKSGDPMDEETYIGTMAREDLAGELEDQLNKSVAQGAAILIGGKREKAYFEPTVVGAVTPEMSIFKEETFGPVIGITVFETEEEAVALVNRSEFGLGVSLFTQDFHRAKKLVPQFDDGAVFINELVKSDPRLPFGGTKISGYGRELSMDGIQEFVNKKTVYFHKF
ncbi:NAD-dependent succinate-semialdehyde dehydrogenase [Sinomicrobium pectinilyticum]|uniref:NAD-dependent succinate-semialdehyde dehydrogenase n=1 Tax=Sinomicrobium pectinilyticum TaxID=1084421 RepID=A0A3N0EHR7_SINP1|nr:NAD-dependent succinate-semialdehyde dehydrogenase [Sinomicrobium pectinilyticum]RNL87219.1 NAD-dependent succinate-semialdehyde dehydrogenase [Sinomicrobium pectinilyticum]